MAWGRASISGSALDNNVRANGVAWRIALTTALVARVPSHEPKITGLEIMNARTQPFTAASNTVDQKAYRGSAADNLQADEKTT
jgi:hypothetical protein